MYQCSFKRKRTVLKRKSGKIDDVFHHRDRIKEDFNVWKILWKNGPWSLICCQAFGTNKGQSKCKMIIFNINLISFLWFYFLAYLWRFRLDFVDILSCKRCNFKLLCEMKKKQIEGGGELQSVHFTLYCVHSTLYSGIPTRIHCYHFTITIFLYKWNAYMFCINCYKKKLCMYIYKCKRRLIFNDNYKFLPEPLCLKATFAPEIKSGCNEWTPKSKELPFTK